MHNTYYYIYLLHLFLNEKHRSDCMNGRSERSLLPEHAWTQDHTFSWDNVTVIVMQTVLKEAIHIQVTLETLE